MTAIRIVCRYRSRPNSNVGKVTATALGRQRSVTMDPALYRDENYVAAARALAESLAEIGAVPGTNVRQVQSSDDGCRRVFEVYA